jgi:hypothetical protein
MALAGSGQSGATLRPGPPGDGRMAPWTKMPRPRSCGASMRCCRRRSASAAATMVVVPTRGPSRRGRQRAIAVHPAAIRRRRRSRGCSVSRRCPWIAPAANRGPWWSRESTNRSASAARCALRPAPWMRLSVPPSSCIPYLPSAVRAASCVSRPARSTALRCVRLSANGPAPMPTWRDGATVTIPPGANGRLSDAARRSHCRRRCPTPIPHARGGRLPLLRLSLGRVPGARADRRGDRARSARGRHGLR